MTPKIRKILTCTLLVIGAALIAVAIFLAFSDETILVNEDSKRTSVQVGSYSVNSNLIVSTVKLSPATFASGAVGLVCLGIGLVLFLKRSTPPPLPPEN